MNSVAENVMTAKVLRPSNGGSSLRSDKELALWLVSHSSSISKCVYVEGEHMRSTESYLLG